MTDPLMPGVCCRAPTKYSQFFDMMLEINSEPYNITCLISATCGILGAMYQILPEVSANYLEHWYWITNRRGRKIVVWLALSDLLAALGVFVRSLFQLLSPSVILRLKSNSVYCYLLAFWIQYFYAVCWFWNLMYAIDILLAVREEKSYNKIYHIVTWILPIIFTSVGLYFLYYPNFECFCSSKSIFWRFFPNYVVSYGPLLAVMIALPILYYLSSGSVPVIVSQYLSQYTNRERHIVNMIKIRFSLINLIFYACWLPNIINMILLYTVWENWNRRFIITIWYIMAIMNPLQALFNCFVYQKSENKMILHWNRSSSTFLKNYYEQTEQTPLIARKNGSSNNSDEVDFVL